MSTKARYDFTFSFHCRIDSKSRDANGNAHSRNAPWKSEPGGVRGIVLSVSDDLTRELHFVNPKNNALELLPHSSLFDGGGGGVASSSSSCFSLTVTRAECESVRRKWAEGGGGKACPRREEDGGGEAEQRFVSEVGLNLAAVDVVLSPKDMMPYVKMFSHLVIFFYLSSF